MRVGPGDPRRLQDFLAAKLKLSRRAAKDLVDRRLVWVNRKCVWIAGYALNGGDEVETAKAVPKAPVKFHVRVLWSDANYLVCDKPAGVLTCGDERSAEAILRAQESLPSLAAVHRLDRDTTGCVLFAKTEAAREAAVEVFRTRRVSKTYHAIGAGEFRYAHQKIDAELDGESAVSYVTREMQGDGACFLRVRIETGRTNQIRRHLASVRCPVVGDRVFGLKRARDPRLMQVPRQMLHASTLSLPNPLDPHTEISVHSPLPADFRAALGLFGMGRGKAPRRTRKSKPAASGGKGEKMRKLVFAVAAAACASMAFAEYEAKWESLDSRPVPQWWQDAKFGIFIHWGPYAVPAFGNITKDGKFAWDCYAEWYQGFMLKGKKPYLEHHEKFYHNAPYGNFAAQFKAEHFDPAEWARLFKQAGAKYVVLTSKHHDGYALWPSPESPYYNAVAMGSGRDLAGEFCKAMREAGLKRGFYFSMLEYANPLYPGIRDGQPSPTALTPEEWNRRVNLPQLKELAENYEADIIWPDGEWDYPSDRHCSKEYLAWLFNESKVKDTVVVNDRWGKECRGHHGGHYTTEYVLEGGDASGDSAAHPWEECRGIGNSFGYSKFETPKDYMSRERCVETLVNCVSRGGNLLLNVGPTADGRIPAIMQDRLLAIGRWLDVNGEAIYASAKWDEAPKGLKGVYFTRKADDLYLISFASGRTPITAKTGEVKSVAVLGAPAVKVEWSVKDGVLTVVPPAFAAGECPCEFAPVLKIAR